MRCGSRPVVDRVAYQRKHIFIGERVENMLGLAPPLDQARRMKRLQPRGQIGDLFALLFGQFGDACLALGEPHRETDPFRIAEQAEQRKGGSPRRRKSAATAG